MSNLPQQITINQYTADGATSVFNYTYLLPLNTDVQVYLTQPGQQPVLQILSTDYTVQNVGNENGGTITFVSMPGNGVVVTFIRDIQASIDTQYNEARNINGQNLDDDFGRITLVSQQYITYFNAFGLQYNIGTEMIAGSNIIPRLANNQVWVGQNGNVIAATLEQNPDVSLLRSQLANEGNGTAGALLVGYYDIANSIGTTVSAFLDSIKSVGIAKAWAYVHVTSGVATLVKSFNVTSVTYNGAGDTTLTFTNTLSDGNGSKVYGMNNFGFAQVQDETATQLRTLTADTSSVSTDLDYYVVIYD